MNGGSVSGDNACTAITGGMFVGLGGLSCSSTSPAPVAASAVPGYNVR